MDVEKGLVNICPVERTYSIEVIRVKLREMVEKIRANKIVKFLEGMVKFRDIESEEAIENFIEEMMEIFSNVEDFNPEKTRYYISHNIGYRVADHLTHCEYCKNWRENGGKGLSYYCNPDEICKMRIDGKSVVIHPLDYLCYNINRHVRGGKERKRTDNC